MADDEAPQVASVGQLRRDLTDEITIALGFSVPGWMHKLLTPALWWPTHRFATLAAQFDRIVLEQGLREAARWFLYRLVTGVRVRGEERVPEKGPLLIASNHPGAMDGFTIVANLPRDDVNVVATGQPFFRHLIASQRHIIYTPREGPGRATVVREMIRRLDEGNSLLIMPSGNVDPDPAILPGASEALRRWSPSLELILRRRPETQVQVTVVSGVLSPRWLQHPLVRLRKGARERQLLAEMLQTIQQAVFGGRLSFAPRVTFAQPITGAELQDRSGSRGLLEGLIEHAQAALDDHQAAFAGELTQAV